MVRWLVRGDGLAFLGGPWFDDGMSAPDRARVVSATLEIAAPAQAIFELIADPALQPQWDGNDNLGSAEPGQRVRGVDDAFRMTLRSGAVRENRVVEFEEGRRIAWLPAEVGTQPPGHLWRWELEPIGRDATSVRHTYDWSNLTDERRFPRAQQTTADRLLDSMRRLKEIAERR